MEPEPGPGISSRQTRTIANEVLETGTNAKEDHGMTMMIRTQLRQTSQWQQQEQQANKAAEQQLQAETVAQTDKHLYATVQLDYNLQHTLVTTDSCHNNINNGTTASRAIGTFIKAYRAGCKVTSTRAD
eukprot:scaffold68358_cov15-Tisochrysis_lutea.AAC.1